MTDRQIICTFMEPEYRKTQVSPGDWSVGGWWIRGRIAWFTREITLNKCHKVEARLTDEQYNRYLHKLGSIFPEELRIGLMVNASAEHKIPALAAILRPLVEVAP